MKERKNMQIAAFACIRLAYDFFGTHHHPITKVRKDHITEYKWMSQKDMKNHTNKIFLHFLHHYLTA